MKKPPQRQRVLASLEAAGPRGITQGDWLSGLGVDGRGSITRLAARINDLRARGYKIEVGGERNGFAVYKLQPKLELLPEPEPDERLFAPPPIDAIRGAA